MPHDSSERGESIFIEFKSLCVEFGFCVANRNPVEIGNGCATVTGYETLSATLLGFTTHGEGKAVDLMPEVRIPAAMHSIRSVLR